MNLSVSGFLKPSMNQDCPKERVFQKQILRPGIGYRQLLSEAKTGNTNETGKTMTEKWEKLCMQLRLKNKLLLWATGAWCSWKLSEKLQNAFKIIPQRVGKSRHLSTKSNLLMVEGLNITTLHVVLAGSTEELPNCSRNLLGKKESLRWEAINMPETFTKAAFREVLKRLGMGVNVLATGRGGGSTFSYLICPQNNFFHEASQLIWL